MHFKPDGYNAVSPYLIVDGAQRTIDFLVAVFDAEPLRRIPGDGATLAHAEVRIDDSVLMFCDACRAGRRSRRMSTSMRATWTRPICAHWPPAPSQCRHRCRRTMRAAVAAFATQAARPGGWGSRSADGTPPTRRAEAGHARVRLLRWRTWRPGDIAASFTGRCRSR